MFLFACKPTGYSTVLIPPTPPTSDSEAEDEDEQIAKRRKYQEAQNDPSKHHKTQTIVTDEDFVRLHVWYKAVSELPSARRTKVSETELIKSYSNYADGGATSDVAKRFTNPNGHTSITRTRNSNAVDGSSLQLSLSHGHGTHSTADSQSSHSHSHSHTADGSLSHSQNSHSHSHLYLHQQHLEQDSDPIVVHDSADYNGYDYGTSIFAYYYYYYHYYYLR